MTFNEALTKDVKGFLDSDWQKVDLLLHALKEDFSLSILRTSPNEQAKREELYYTAKAVDAISLKLQEAINEANTQHFQGALNDE